MTLRKSKHSRDMTPAQEVANRRSFLIFRLRGLWHSASMLSGWRKAVAQLCIDGELLLLGAQTETHCWELRLAEWNRLAREEVELEDMF